MKTKSFLVLAAALLASPSLAEAKRGPKSVKCVPPSAFVQQIYNCGRNHVAVHFAQECARSLKNKAQANGQALQLVMNELQKLLKLGQDHSMKDTVARLNIAIAALEAQIKEFEENADIVATYTDAMIDFPNGVDDSTSAECFNTAFHSLQKIVYALDDETLNSKRARDEALALAQLAAQYDKKLDNTSPNQMVTGIEAGGRPQPVPVKKVPGARQSDISGTEKLKNP